MTKQNEEIPKISRQNFEEDIKQRAMKSLEEKGFYEGQMKAYLMCYHSWSTQIGVMKMTKQEAYNYTYKELCAYKRKVKHGQIHCQRMVDYLTIVCECIKAATEEDNNK